MSVLLLKCPFFGANSMALRDSRYQIHERVLPLFGKQGDYLHNKDFDGLFITLLLEEKSRSPSAGAECGLQ
jgi:hypothetical protein